MHCCYRTGGSSAVHPPSCHTHPVKALKSPGDRVLRCLAVPCSAVAMHQHHSNTVPTMQSSTALPAQAIEAHVARTPFESAVTASWMEVCLHCEHVSPPTTHQLGQS